MYKVSSDPVDIQQLGKYLAALGITGTAAAALTKKLNPAAAAANKIASAVYSRHMHKVAGVSDDVDTIMRMRRKKMFGGDEAVGDLAKRHLLENMEEGRRLGAVLGTFGGGAAGLGYGLADDSLAAVSPILAAMGAGAGNVAGRGLGIASGAMSTPGTVLKSLIGTPITRGLSRSIF
jgi:hypothetical protein